MVIEKTGHKKETQELLELLQPYGVLEFVRSGRVSISKPMRELSEYLEEIEENLKAQRV
jgi:acetolactate synthase-1/3 small subunit